MHYGNFFVVNLCDTYYSSDGLIGQYHPNMLFNQARSYPQNPSSPRPMLKQLGSGA